MSKDQKSQQKSAITKPLVFELAKALPRIDDMLGFHSSVTSPHSLNAPGKTAEKPGADFAAQYFASLKVPIVQRTSLSELEKAFDVSTLDEKRAKANTIPGLPAAAQAAFASKVNYEKVWKARIEKLRAEWVSRLEVPEILSFYYEQTTPERQVYYRAHLGLSILTAPDVQFDPGLQQKEPLNGRSRVEYYRSKSKVLLEFVKDFQVITDILEDELWLRDVPKYRQELAALLADEALLQCHYLMKTESQVYLRSIYDLEILTKPGLAFDEIEVARAVRSREVCGCEWCSIDKQSLHASLMERMIALQKNNPLKAVMTRNVEAQSVVVAEAVPPMDNINTDSLAGEYHKNLVQHNSQYLRTRDKKNRRDLRGKTTEVPAVVPEVTPEISVGEEVLASTTPDQNGFDRVICALEQFGQEHSLRLERLRSVLGEELVLRRDAEQECRDAVTGTESQIAAAQALLSSIPQDDMDAYVAAAGEHIALLQRRDESIASYEQAQRELKDVEAQSVADFTAQIAAARVVVEGRIALVREVFTALQFDDMEAMLARLQQDCREAVFAHRQNVVAEIVATEIAEEVTPEPERVVPEVMVDTTLLRRRSKIGKSVKHLRDFVETEDEVVEEAVLEPVALEAAVDASLLRRRGKTLVAVKRLRDFVEMEPTFEEESVSSDEAQNKLLDVEEAEVVVLPDDAVLLAGLELDRGEFDHKLRCDERGLLFLVQRAITAGKLPSRTWALRVIDELRLVAE